ncbi:MAG: 50S ribosomal protein L19 [Elusimicrobia bacterium RIFCSPLOWO2_01_FULL_59_12]|nr:MAG: 50S ribosomal protein L19 [Elusimicrobia bacterium RIFCSPLOWO2_01_FULL_59_12]
MKISIDDIERAHYRKSVPSFRVGDQVRLTLKIIEGESERLQAFEGTVIRSRGHGLSRTFTVRKISYGIGVERTLLLHSPRIEKIEVMRSGHVRRSRLYFLRNRSGKAARLDEKLDHRDAGAEGPAAPVAKEPPLSAAPART